MNAPRVPPTSGAGDAIIRLAAHEDIDALLAIGHDRTELPDLLSVPTWPGRHRRITVICLSRDGMPLGSSSGTTLRGTRHAWVVGYTRVTPAARGRGIGSAVTLERDRVLRQLGARWTYCTITPTNAPSLAMAARKGYVTVGWKTKLVGQPAPTTSARLIARHPVRRRRSLRAVGRAPSFEGLATAAPTRTRPLGLFPLHWPCPHHEVHTLLGRGQRAYLVSRAGAGPATIAVAWGESVLAGREATAAQIMAMAGNTNRDLPTPRWLYTLDEPPLTPRDVEEQWCILGKAH